MRWSSSARTGEILPRAHPRLSTGPPCCRSAAAAAEVHAAPEGVLRLADRDALALPACREPLVLRLRLALADLHAGLGGGAAAARLALIECLLAERLALGGVGAGIQAALRGVLRLRLAVGRARVGWRRRAPVRVAGALDGRRQVRAAVVATAFPVAAGLQRAPLLGAAVGAARRRIAVEDH